MNDQINSRIDDSMTAVKVVWLALDALDHLDGVADMQAVLHRAMADLEKARELVEAPVRHDATEIGAMVINGLAERGELAVGQ